MVDRMIEVLNEHASELGVNGFKRVMICPDGNGDSKDKINKVRVTSKLADLEAKVDHLTLLTENVLELIEAESERKRAVRDKILQLRSDSFYKVDGR
jgi:hypothetical protein